MTVSRQKQSPAARTGLHIHLGGYHMVPQLIARVDGLPVCCSTARSCGRCPTAGAIAPRV